VRAITGGDTKRFVGGVIVCFIILWMVLVTGGFMVHYFFFNTRIDVNEITDLSGDHYHTASYQISVSFFYSLLIEPEVQFTSFDPKE